MKETYQRIELGVGIPGPRLQSQPLLSVERTFLNRYRPGLAERIDQGLLWPTN